MPCIVVGSLGAGFLPSGMTKNGSFSIPSTSFTKVTAWTADTTNYPGSTVTTDGIVAQGTKSSATIASTCSVTNGGGSASTVTLKLQVNGVDAVTGSGTSVGGFATVNVSVSGTVNINSGDIVTVFVEATTTFSMSINTGTGTFVHIT